MPRGSVVRRCLTFLHSSLSTFAEAHLRASSRARRSAEGGRDEWLKGQARVRIQRAETCGGARRRAEGGREVS